MWGLSPSPPDRSESEGDGGWEVADGEGSRDKPVGGLTGEGKECTRPPRDRLGEGTGTEVLTGAVRIAHASPGLFRSTVWPGGWGRGPTRLTGTGSRKIFRREDLGRWVSGDGGLGSAGRGGCHSVAGREAQVRSGPGARRGLRSGRGGGPVGPGVSRFRGRGRRDADGKKKKKISGVKN